MGIIYMNMARGDHADRQFERAVAEIDRRPSLSKHEAAQEYATACAVLANTRHFDAHWGFLEAGDEDVVVFFDNHPSDGCADRRQAFTGALRGAGLGLLGVGHVGSGPLADYTTAWVFDGCRFDEDRLHVLVYQHLLSTLPALKGIHFDAVARVGLPAVLR